MYKRQVYRGIYSTDHQFVGDVSFYNLPYANNIINDYPDVKFVILQRDRTETIRSYLKKTSGRNHWQDHKGSGFRLCPWDQCYPKFTANNKEHALEQYWELYYNTCKDIDQSRCFWMSTSELNEETKCKEMLTFCGYETPVYEQIQLNKT